MTIQLRRYELVPEEVDAFVAWFPRIVAAREKYGFKVEFAYLDREHCQFIWAVSHDGDFEARLEEYNASPERAAAFAGQPTRVAEMHVAYVDRVV